MAENRESHDSDPKSAESQAAAIEPLTEAQRAFARVLGRLLAQRWQEEQHGLHAKERKEE